jgi:hypothetical protein
MFTLRAGLIGLMVAFLIYSLWKISARFHGVVLPEKYGDILILLSGILLWIVWFTIAQVILIAYDELNVYAS